jgi:AcrR family transcriptional regulator
MVDAVRVSEAEEMAQKVRDLREACVSEAFAIIGDVGVEGLSIREVARRIGVSHQAPYKHFASSDHLLAEVVRRTYATFSAHLRSRRLTGVPHEDMHTLGVAYFEFAQQNPLHYRLMFGTPLPNPEEHPEMMAEARQAFTILLDAVTRLHGHARPRKSDHLDALFVWAAVHGIATILQTEALKQINLQHLLPEAFPHTLRCIGAAMEGHPERGK